jgi:hypothetical protein
VTRASEQVARPKTPERIGALAAGDARPDKDQIVGPSSAPLLLKPGEVPNVPETPIEAARRKTVVRVLDSVGMNQLRLLALARMTTDPTRSWTGSQMDEELNRLQGGEPGFQLGRDSSQNDMVSRYGVNFLQNKDLIHLEDEGVTRMRARAEQAEIAYATAGTLLAWQAENPEIPLQKIFGNLHRVAPILHRGYSNMRLAIAEQVLTRDGRSYSDISRALGESIQRTQIAIRGMTDADVLAVGESTVRPGWGRAGISMNPQYRQPLTDLIGHLKNLKSDDGIRIAKEVTEYLLGSEETVARLMAIARENAWNKNRSRPTR